MVDRYWRKIENVENDIENSMQISSILLKLKEYDNDLGKIDTNENNISSNSGLINTNTGTISTNSGLISVNTGDISTNSGLISTNTGDISTNSGLISTSTSSIASNLGKINNNSGLISTNTGDITSNLSKINNIENDMKLSNEYNETFVIPHKSSNNWDVGIIFDKTIKFKFTSNGIIKINAIYNYICDIKYNFKHVYRFYYNKTAFFNRTELYHNRISNIVTDEFEIQSINISEIRLKIYLIANGDSQEFKLNDNSIQIMYNETNLKSDINKNNIESNLEKMNDNSSDIESNLEKINDNSSAIESNSEKINDLQNNNVKAFYNLDKIFIYDIEKGYQTVNKDNHYHIFEKEITYDFTKNSYLEIILKVLTEVSNYVLIGYFQILCNFYDQDNNLFYTISLSTAAGSINKLSTVKSVFIVPINENMSKIKIDFFIAPKATQQNRSAKFIIQDINSNKIYIKYFQKTDEMSIKNIQDSLNTVNNITADLEKIDENKDNIASNLKK